jgi:hypothetical protein
MAAIRNWHRYIGALLLCATAGLRSASAQTETPVLVTFPNQIDDLFTAVSYNPRFRVGSFYVGGSNGVATLGAPSTLVAPLSRVSKIATFGGSAQRSGVFILSEGSNAVHVYDPGLAGAPQMTGTNQVMTDMWKNQRMSQLLTLDIGPTLGNIAQRRGALVQVWSTDDRSTIAGFKIQKSINSFDYPLCPCAVAADPNDFRETYAIARSDTVTAHRFVNQGAASATGQIVVSSPTGTPQLLGQIIADTHRAYVTDSQGRLHVVIPLGEDPIFAGEAMTLATRLTGFTIAGTLVRDTALLSPYFLEVGGDLNVPPNAPSAIRVFAGEAGGPALVATIPTATNSLGPFTFTPLEIFFWDGAALKGMRRGTWKVRNIPNVPVDGAGNPVHYDDFENAILIPVGLRNVVVSVDAGLPSPIAPNDLSGDNKSDLIFRNSTTGDLVGFLMNGGAVQSGAGLLGPGAWTIIHTADLNGDGKADLILKNLVDNTAVIFTMNGLAVTNSTVVLGANSGWTVTHAADFNGDGKADLLLRNTDGSLVVWTMDGISVTGGALVLGAASGFTPTHTADFNGDGKADILLRNVSNGQVVLFTMNGISVTSGSVVLGASSGYTPTHTGDLNGDGKADILFRNDTDGSIVAFLMNGASVTGSAAIVGAGAWRVNQVADYNGDGKADLLLRNTDGTLIVFTMNGTAVTSSGVVLGANTVWNAVQGGDYNGDGKADIILRNNDGTIVMFLMNGTAVTTGATILGPGSYIVVPTLL